MRRFLREQEATARGRCPMAFPLEVEEAESGVGPANLTRVGRSVLEGFYGLGLGGRLGAAGDHAAIVSVNILRAALGADAVLDDPLHDGRVVPGGTGADTLAASVSLIGRCIWDSSSDSAVDCA